jgi:hypothetical protein
MSGPAEITLASWREAFGSLKAADFAFNAMKIFEQIGDFETWEVDRDRFLSALAAAPGFNRETALYQLQKFQWRSLTFNATDSLRKTIITRIHSTFTKHLSSLNT